MSLRQGPKPSPRSSPTSLAEILAFVRLGALFCPLYADNWMVNEARSLALMVTPPIDERLIAAKREYLIELLSKIGKEAFCLLYSDKLSEADLIVHALDPSATRKPTEPGELVLNELERMGMSSVRPAPPADAGQNGVRYCLDPDVGEWTRDCVFLQGLPKAQPPTAEPSMKVLPLRDCSEVQPEDRTLDCAKPAK